MYVFDGKDTTFLRNRQTFPHLFRPPPPKRREPKPSPISLLLIIYTDYSDGAFHVAALSVGDVARTVTGPDCCVERRMRSS